MYRSHTQSTSSRLTDPLYSPPDLWKHQDAAQFGVFTEMITYMVHIWPPQRLLRICSHGRANHLMQLT
jgi:hypothetical protein